MDNRIAGLLGAAAALTTVTAAQAAAPIQSELAPAMSYQELLAPVPKALAALQADDARLAQMHATGSQLAQYYRHHHHHHFRRRHHHHHHHHYYE